MTAYGASSSVPSAPAKVASRPNPADTRCCRGWLFRGLIRTLVRPCQIRRYRRLLVILEEHGEVTFEIGAVRVEANDVALVVEGVAHDLLHLGGQGRLGQLLCRQGVFVDINPATIFILADVGQRADPGP